MVKWRMTEESKADSICQLSDIQNNEEALGQLTRITPVVWNIQRS